MKAINNYVILKEVSEAGASDEFLQVPSKRWRVVHINDDTSRLTTPHVFIDDEVIANVDGADHYTANGEAYIIVGHREIMVKL